MLLPAIPACIAGNIDTSTGMPNACFYCSTCSHRRGQTLQAISIQAPECLMLCFYCSTCSHRRGQTLQTISIQALECLMLASIAPLALIGEGRPCRQYRYKHLNAQCLLLLLHLLSSAGADLADNIDTSTGMPNACFYCSTCSHRRGQTLQTISIQALECLMLASIAPLALIGGCRPCRQYMHKHWNA